MLGKVVQQLQTVHALKSGALGMFDPMLTEVRKQKDAEALSEVQNLLEKMLGAFGDHEATTREHERRLAARLLQAFRRQLASGSHPPAIRG